MPKYYFQCLFLSDVIINAHTATAGPAQSLDYIPGSNFLGIVAQNYRDFGKQAFEVFHGGQVRFGDGHIAANGDRSLKMPLAWYCPKGESFQDAAGHLDSDKIYIYHALPPLEETLRASGTQLKQIRQGFFLNSGALPELNHFFAVKSAYDSQKRRAREKQMYGYDALQAGSEWIFSVESEDQDLLKRISAMLVGRQHIGRSRSSQYGRVNIVKLDTEVAAPACTEKVENGIIVLYAESNLAFFDAYGEPTLLPGTQELKLPSTLHY